MSIYYTAKQIFKPVFTDSAGNHVMSTNFKVTMAVKRCLDIIFSVIAIAIFIVPCLIVAFCIWLEDKHNPIFHQERIGKGGKPFTLYKFRSMRIDAEKDDKPQLYCDHDARLTNIGTFLRDHHLDELPQFWNVLKGDMSFVGYRPERKYFIDKIMENDPRYTRLYKIRPGLFSDATLYNGYTDTMEKMLKRLEMDLDYLNNISVGRDIKIIYHTGMSIVTGKKF